MQAPSNLLVVLIFFVILAASIDLHKRRIPNLLILIGLIAAVVGQFYFFGTAGLSNAAGGSSLALILLLPFYLARGMAAGDVKMMMVVGAFVGPMAVLKITLVTFLVGGVMAIAIIAFSGKFRTAFANMQAILLSHVLRTRTTATEQTEVGSDASIKFPSVGRMPYGPAIALATVIVMAPK